MTTHTRTWLRTLGVAALVLGAAGTLVAEPKTSKSKYGTEVYFSPNGGAADATATAIKGAKSTVDVAMYSIHTGGAIFESLEAAAARGVKIRMVLNKAAGDAKVKALKLESIGVDVRYVTKTMHEKFAIVDGAKVLNGSGNWSASSDVKYNENMVAFQKNGGLTGAFQSEFDYLWAIARDFKADGSVTRAGENPDATPPSGGGGTTSAYFTSANDTEGESVIASHIIDAIRGAKTSIEIAVAHFNHPDIAAALLQAHKDNPALQVRVLVDQGEYAAGISQVKSLESKKIPVRYKAYSMGYTHGRAQLMHHKYMLIDRATLISGSYNWSKTAEHQNYENIIVVEKNPYLVRRFTEEFEKLWDFNRDRYAAFKDAVLSKPGDANYKRILPLHFDSPYFGTPMALTRDEFKPIRSALYKYGFFKDRKFVTYSFFDKETGKPVSNPPSGTFADKPAPGASVVDLLPH